MQDYYKSSIVRFLRVEGETRPAEELEPQLTFIESTIHPDLGELREYNGSLGVFWVSSRGNVTDYWAPERPPVLESLSSEDAVKLASEFILRHQPDFADRNFVTIRSEVEESRWEGMWQENPVLPKEFSVFPNIVEVSVNLWTHAVRRYSFSDLRLVRKTPPLIKEAEARKKFLAEFEKAVIDKIELMEKPIDGGKSAFTVWRAIVLTPASTGLVPNPRLINADTGAPVPY